MGYIITALTLGLAGSLHCVGMCGPIALALPYNQSDRLRALGSVLLYNGGRVVTYTFMGTFIGLLGKGLFLMGIQTYLSIFFGFALLLVAIFSINVEAKIVSLPGVNKFYNALRQKLGQYIKGRSLFAVGLLNGFVPCGLVYMAIVGAITSGGIAQGALFMLSFGLGTIPLMAATAIGGQLVTIKLRNRIRKLYPALLVVIALLFLMRGFNFQIPADMRFWEDMSNVPMCH